jgi:hypothetical protein
VWPSLWGAGWWWGVVAALSVMAGLFGGVIILGSIRTAAPCADPLRELWKRYEQGDLTSWEFERLIRAGNVAAWAAPARAPRPTRACTSANRSATLWSNALGQLFIAATLLVRRRPTSPPFHLGRRREPHLAASRSAHSCRPPSRFDVR